MPDRRDPDRIQHAMFEMVILTRSRARSPDNPDHKSAQLLDIERTTSLTGRATWRRFGLRHRLTRGGEEPRQLP
jgi:hypothetical protein